MKTNETQALSTLSADGKLHLHCPKSWAELSQQQLHYVLDLLGCGLYDDVVTRLCHAVSNSTPVNGITSISRTGRSRI